MDDLKAKLLGSGSSASGKAGHRDRKNVERAPNASSRHEAMEVQSACGTSVNQIVNDSHRRNSRGRERTHLRHLFLKRLAIALHSYGSFASRTEYLLKKVAGELEMDVEVAVFPALILLTFSDSDGQGATQVLKGESHLDVDKLTSVDVLANQVGIEDHKTASLLLAYWRLKTIATRPPTFSNWWWRLFGYTLSASTSAMVFFNGSTYDELFALPLGFLVGGFDLLSTRSAMFGTLLNFVATLVVSFIARIFSFYLGRFNLHFGSMVLGSLVQLLPGLTLTLGISEMMAKSHVTGSSRIIFALFSVLQLGFGIIAGKNFVFWISDPVDMDCGEINFYLRWNLLWFLPFSAASLVLLKARSDQWPAMMITAVYAFLVLTVARDFQLNASASTVLGAFSIGIIGTMYSHCSGDAHPLPMTSSGIVGLYPRGIDVKGIAALLQDNLLSRMSVLFNILILGFCITLGLLISKLVLARPALFGSGKTVANNKATWAPQIQDNQTSNSPSLDKEETIIVVPV